MKVFKIREGAKLPTKADGDMCYDIFACFNDYEFMVVKHGDVTPIPTGIKIALPPGYHASIRPRSGLAVKNGISVEAGQIDNNYRGEWIIALTSHKHKIDGQFFVKSGDKIAQFKLEKDETFPVEEVFNENDLGETERGEKGFGSSGV